MSDAILTLNAGSSSLKFAVFAPEPIMRGQIAGIGGAPQLIARDPAGAVLVERNWDGGTHEDFLAELLGWITTHLGGAALSAVGHRVVHGGGEFSAPVLIDPAVLAALEQLCPLAPLHQPHNLAAIRAMRALRPDLPQIACFDTGFHATQAAVATRFALPRCLTEAGVRRYGFHGLSYEYVGATLRAMAPGLATGQVIVAHLGNGASLCAMSDGASVDTTMGFTALDGLVMGTRCGALDPGVVLHLLRQYGMTGEAIEDLLYRQSGMLGVSGISGDMRVLLASEAPEARDAIDLFVFRLVREIGALAASLGGLDGLVFTAGIGENAPAIRASVADRLGWLGVTLDPVANARGVGRISTGASAIEVWVVPTDEETMIARHVGRLVGGGFGAAPPSVRV